MDPLLAISPVDGRYAGKTAELSAFFSECALMRYRVLVEVEYFIALCEMPLPQLEDVDPEVFPQLRAIYGDFTAEDAARIKEIERRTNHDVKAVEYFLKERFADLGLSAYAEFIHFGLTSQDINNTATPLSLKEALAEVYMPALRELLDMLSQRAALWADVPMLAHTHGQPASPTRLGKELEVFIVRLKEQLRQLEERPYPGKFGGATGNMNAHYVAYPDIEWNSFAEQFVASLGLKRSYPTTQIDHYDNLAAIFDALRRINTVLVDLSRDCWLYISMEYFDAAQDKSHRLRKRRRQPDLRQRHLRLPLLQAAGLAPAARPDGLHGLAQHRRPHRPLADRHPLPPERYRETDPQRRARGPGP
jgi:adenylosuccinate lyase